MRPWPLLAAASLACGPAPPLVMAPVAPEQAPVTEAERRRASECARGLVARADVVRVDWSRYRGRPALAVALSSPNDGQVDAYYGSGPGCDLVALVGEGPLDAEVQPGPPFRSLADARLAALARRDGLVTAWALERGDGGAGRWVYRFDVDAEGGVRPVEVDAAFERPRRPEARSAPPAAAATAARPPGREAPPPAP